MGLFISRLKTFFEGWGTSPVRIVMLGQDAAGKTTALYKIKLNETVTTIPTTGFNAESATCRVNGLQATVWNIRGQNKIRPLSKRYTENCEGLIYVVDSAKRERMSEAREELFGILEGAEMTGVPVCVLANKQDLPNALTPSKIMEELHLQKLVGRKWYIQAACATTGDGISEGMERLAAMVKELKYNRKC